MSGKTIELKISSGKAVKVHSDSEIRGSSSRTMDVPTADALRRGHQHY